MNLDDIEKLIKFMEEHGLTELQVKDEALEFKARRGDRPNPPFIVQQSSGHALAAPAPLPPPVSAGGGESSAPKGKGEEPRAENLKEICSPIVGTFYRRPNPNATPFVEIGDRVEKDTVVCIVEAMKVMNEIKADVKGKVTKLLVDDASPVEFGQPLYLVEPE